MGSDISIEWLPDEIGDVDSVFEKFWDCEYMAIMTLRQK